MTIGLILLGHRGAPAFSEVPENTIESFDLALQHGCDGFEFDVRQTSDRQLVICHDKDVGGHLIASSSQAQLSLLTLNEVLERYANRGFLNIEIKQAGLENNFLSALQEHHLERLYLVSSFLPQVIQELRLKSPQLPLGIICETPDQLKIGLTLPTEAVMAQEALASEQLIAQLHEKKKSAFVWTVNSAASMRRLQHWGADGILSDDPRLLKETLRPNKN